MKQPQARKTGVPPVVLDLTWHAKQREVYTSAASVIVHAKGRRFGGTEGGMRWQLGKCIQNQNHRALWMDLTHRNTQRYWKRYALRSLKPLADEARKRGEDLDKYVKMNWGEASAKFWTGSYMDFASAERPENAEGQAYDTILLNEAGHACWDPVLIDETLMPMLIENPSAQIIITGAPKGMNKMHHLAQLAEAGEPGHAFFRHTSFDNPFLSPEAIKRFTRGMTQAMYDQEIMAQFVDDGTRYFQNSDEVFRGDGDGPQSHPGHLFVIGADPAKVNDWFDVWVVCVTCQRGIHHERWQRIPWRDSERRVQALSALYGLASIWLDATGIGDHVLESLAALGLNVHPVVFTAQTKTDLMSSLAVSIQNREFTCCEDEVTMAELRAFRSTRMPSGNLKLEAPPGLHDDAVCSLALANQGRLSGGVIGVIGIPNLAAARSGILTSDLRGGYDDAA